MKIEEFKNITIAYMRRVGEYGPENETLMEALKDYLINHNYFHDETIILGIALDNPAFTSVSELRYDVGFIIDDTMKTALNIRKIEDGKYAIFEVAHTKQDILSFWQNITQLTANLAIDEKKPIIERYAMNKIADHLCEFCIPIK